jgi:hypothetical protein
LAILASECLIGLAGFLPPLLNMLIFPVITDDLILAVKKEIPVYNAHRG